MKKLYLPVVLVLCAISVTLMVLMYMESRKKESFRCIAEASRLKSLNEINPDELNRVKHLSNEDFLEEIIPDAMPLIQNKDINVGVSVYQAAGFPVRFVVFLTDENTKEIIYFNWVGA